MSLITVAVPVSRSYSRRAALMPSSVRCRISSQSGPIDHPVRVVAAGLFAPFLGVPDLLQQFRAARRVLVLALTQRLLHARGFQRVQHRAGHVFLQ
jgi:hypothetical protein